MDDSMSRAEYHHRYYLENKEDILKRNKKWRKNNAERYKQVKRRWYLANREQILAKMKDKRNQLILKELSSQ
jgi:hypothetical protein